MEEVGIISGARPDSALEPRPSSGRAKEDIKVDAFSKTFILFAVFYSDSNIDDGDVVDF